MALQLARRENRLQDVGTQIEQMIGNEIWTQRNERAAGVDLFSIFTGALAVQESLQLDAMRGERGRRTPRFTGAPDTLLSPPRENNGDPVAMRKAEQERREAEEKRRKRKVTVDSLAGPTIKSHPWEQMLAGKSPQISPLASYVPEDFYFVEFH